MYKTHFAGGGKAKHVKMANPVGCICMDEPRKPNVGILKQVAKDVYSTTCMQLVNIHVLCAVIYRHILVVKIQSMCGNSIHQWFLGFSMHPNPLEDLLKQRFLGLT